MKPSRWMDVNTHTHTRVLQNRYSKSIRKFPRKLSSQEQFSSIFSTLIKSFAEIYPEKLSSKAWSVRQHHIPRNIFSQKLQVIIRPSSNLSQNSMPCSTYLKWGLINSKGGVGLFQILQKKLSTLGVNLAMCDAHPFPFLASYKKDFLPLRFVQEENICGQKKQEKEIW